MSSSTNIKNNRLGRTLWLSGLLMAAPAWAESRYEEPAAYEQADASYSYARVVEGPATVFAAGNDREPAEPHRPILAGDRLWVPEGSRLEAVLADRSVLRVEGESEITFESIAWSADTADRETSLTVREGRLQLVVPEEVLGDSLPRVSTPGATIYLHREGTFRIQTGEGWTELVVRSGLAELVTERGSLLVHPGELGWTEEGYRPRLELQAAGRRDALERWGDRLTEEARLAEVPYVDDSLRYAAAPLYRHGDWVEVGGDRAWRPHVEVSWRPYYRGYWRHTALGYTWVSADPWGWVTHHYGSWDYVAGYGWVWYPGRIYAPARVHWYWGPTYVGWVPSGYYAHHYAHYGGHHHSGFSLHFGHYGWVSAGWDPFHHWTFTANLHFGNPHYGHYDAYSHHGYGHRGYHERHWDRHYYSGAQLARDRARFERGIVTTDPGVEHRAAKDVFPSLQRRLAELRREQGRDLPEVDSFVARKPLPDDVARVALRKPGAAGPGTVRPAPRVAEKPTVVRTPRREAPRPTVIERQPARVAEKPTVVRTPKPEAPRPTAIEPRHRTYDKPAVTPKPSTRPPVPRVSTPSRSSKPVPRVSTPSRSSKPVPRVSTPSRSSKPVPRVSTPSRSSKPVPRVSTPPRSSKPVPRVSTPRSSRPAPRASTPPRTSRPAPRASSPPRASKPSVSKSPSRSRPPRVSAKPAPSRGSGTKGKVAASKPASKSKAKKKD